MSAKRVTLGHHVLNISAFHHTLIHMLGSIACVWRYFDALRRSSYETLICGPRIVYPLDVLMKGVARWIFLLVCAWLGYWIIPNHVWAYVVTRSNLISPKWGVLDPLIIKFLEHLRF